MLPNVVLFEGIDSTGTTNLWETNGTASGTFELTSSGGPPVAGQPSINGEPAYGFLPNPYDSLDLTVFNNQVLFIGRDSASLSDYWLWTTDGTAADTVQLTSIVGANSAGIFTQATSPDFPDFTVYDGEVLFNGVDTAGDHGLWTTNGTAAGTQEVGGVPGAAGYTGISGAASTGVNPSDMTVFNGEVLFNGADTAGNLGLWMTNGTAAGTSELVLPVSAGARTTGGGLDPTELTVFGNEVLFNAVDASGLSGLWETDGTAAGTHEILAEAAGGGGASDLNGLDPTDITVLGNEVLFNGLDANGHQQLWVTNGTAAGTTELTNITGADASGIAPSDLTVFNGEVLFNGLDKNGQQQLWETNGTVVGTQELAPNKVVRPTNMEVYDGEVLFSGYDLTTHVQGLWETNGTAAGISELTPTATVPDSVGLFPSDLTAVSIATSPPPTSPPPPPSATNFSVLDTTTNTSLPTNGTPYSGPVAGLQWEYIYTGSDNMNVTADVPNVFIHTGSGEDAINVSQANGNNVLDGSTGSNFLVGGTGDDTFFVDDRSPSADIWSTVSNFHAGDAATIFGITQSGFDTSWVNGQGAAGYTGLTLHVTGGGHPIASLTLAGFSTAALSNGQISTTWGTEADGTPYLYVHANS